MHIETEFIADASASADAPKAFLRTGLEPLQAFADRAADIQSLLDDLESVSGKSASKAATRLRTELREFEPAVTMLGQVKSGKTTLVNALAGRSDLLPSDVNPWTSVVTSLHLVPEEDEAPEVGARFKFITEADWDRLVAKGGRLGEMADRAGSETEVQRIREQVEQLREKSRRRLGRKFELLLGQEHEYSSFDKALLERYICTGDDFHDETAARGTSEQGRFSDITQSADLYLKSSSAPYRFCLRDTPGVNDTFMMREQVTINAIRSSRLCVVVLSAHQALTSVDMALIRMISSLQSRDVVIFVNRIDELADPVREVPEIETGIRRVLSENDGPEDVQIIFGSALWAHHVLSDSVDNLSGQSRTALEKWANAKNQAEADAALNADAVWSLSGIPDLNRLMSQRIVEKLGNPLLERIITSAITVASGQQAANKVRVDGDAHTASMSLHDIRSELTRVCDRHRAALTQQMSDLIASYLERADRAHANFIDHATQALIAHLEKTGAADGWNHDPSGLRMLLKSAYSVFAMRARACASKQYEAAVTDIAKLYYAAFGKAVEGIELQVPGVQEFPPPVTLAQTIALDFNNGWWSSWWRKKRGYKAFAKQFKGMLAAETEDFMAQLKTEQTQRIQSQLIETLDAFFLQNRDILIEISTSHGGQDEIERLCLGKVENARLEKMDRLMAGLKGHLRAVENKGVQHG